MTMFSWRDTLTLALVAILPAVIQAIVGVSLTGSHAAADGPFTIGALSQYNAEFSGGTWQPRWAWTGNNGLGSPIFFIYPPGAYFVTALIYSWFPSLAPATVISIMGVIFRALAIGSCALWLGQHFEAKIALAGGAFYALMPYIAYYNPEYRLAYAETSAAALLPLVFLAVDLGHGRFLQTIVYVAGAICLLAFFHLPSIMIAGGLSVIYAGLLASSTNAAIVRIFSVLSGVLLGLALAALDIVPAISLLPEISASNLQNPAFAWSGNFLLKPRGLVNPYFVPLDICFFVPFIAGVAGIRKVIGEPCGRAIVGTFIVSAFLMLPLALPVWKIVYPLQQIQFPWRFLLPMSLMAAALCTDMFCLADAKYRLVILGAFGVVGLITVAVSIMTGDPSHSDAERSRQALQADYVDAPEYMPRVAGTKGWFYFHQKGGNSQERAARAISPCLLRASAPIRTAEKGMAFDVSQCNGQTVFPQFYFPGWSAKGMSDLTVAPDPVSGFVMVNIRPGTKQVTLARKMLNEETLGWRISALAFVAWMSLIACNGYVGHKRDIRANIR